MSVMIVEPSQAVASMLDALFGRFGFESRVVRSGKEALECLRTTPVELLCFAYELGDMNGIDFFVTAKANKLAHHEPGIMFAATNSRTTINRAAMAGVTECFSKHNLAQLERFVERFAGTRRMRIGGRVLLVEDSASAIEFYRQVLNRLGLQVDTCRSAESAIAAFAANKYDLIITDYVLAGSKTGYSVIQSVRESEGKSALTPVLVISSFDDMARKVEILRSGANDFLSKPVVAEELEVRVYNTLMMQKLMHRLESQHEVMKDIAMRDPLTTIYNRYFLNEISAELIADAKASGESLSLIVVDIDHFKQINDSHGHATGDKVLQQVAKTLQGICRREDVVARIGGEEFVVLLPGVPVQEAAARGELARERIASLALPCGLTITVSVGIAGLAADGGYDELFHRADSAMYGAKLAGRNRVEIAA